MAIQHQAKVQLGFFPTPVTKMTRLSKYMQGPELYIKRDDLTGLAFGGNKTRKLEYILATALQQGADTVITAGAAQSNHCRQTAAACAALGLECHLMLGGEPPAHCTGNLLLDELCGATIHWCKENRKGELIPCLQSQLAQAGKSPFVVPYGGSNLYGALGFVNAYVELEEQLGRDYFTHIVFASSSGGTHAGLMVGKALQNSHAALLGIQIDKELLAGKSLLATIVSLANQTGTHLELQQHFTESDVELDPDYLAGGYGVVSDQERFALNLLAKQEGIILDPVYSGRAMAGLLGKIQQSYFSRSDRVLFWHTGGAPAVFAYADSLVNNQRL